MLNKSNNILNRSGSTNISTPSSITKENKGNIFSLGLKLVKNVSFRKNVASKYSSSNALIQPPNSSLYHIDRKLFMLFICYLL